MSDPSRQAAAKTKALQKPYLWAYLFLAPTLVVMALFDYWPLLQTMILSTQTTDLFGRPAGFVGFDNYAAMFADPYFAKTLVTTLVFTVLSVGGKLLVGCMIAIPLSTRLAGTAFARPIVLIPMAFSVAIASVTFKTMFLPKSGTFDRMLETVGITGPGWLTDPQWAMFSVVMVDIWVGIGMVVLLLMAALDSIPASVLEAASLDGVSWRRKIFSIQLPLISPTVFFIVVTQSVSALREFTLLNILTRGGPDQATTTLTFDLYQKAFGSNADYGASTARGIVLMLIVGVLSFIQFRLGEKKVNY